MPGMKKNDSMLPSDLLELHQNPGAYFQSLGKNEQNNTSIHSSNF